MSSVVVIGGGAAGLIAAGTAVRRGLSVTVIEKNARPARKVMITGKGRCNVTNSCEVNDFLNHVVNNPRFLYSSLYAFGPADMMSLLENDLHTPLKVERGNRVFPVSDRAVDIVDALYKYAKGASFRFESVVKKILTENGAVYGVELESGETIPATSVILATGGLSYPGTGSTGEGYKMAEELGHTIVKPCPSLVSLVSDDPDCKEMMGLSLKNVILTVYEKSSRKPVYSEMGEMLFTHFGISGPLVLSASCHLQRKTIGNYVAEIDLKPALDESKLDARLIRDISERTQCSVRNLLGGLLPSKMVPIMLKRCCLPSDKKAGTLTKEERKLLIQNMKRFSVSLQSARSVEEAVVTCGGVKVSEVDPKTMQSKLVSGLYFAGEVLDVDAYTGGYNLQIAFSTGYAAGSWVE